MNVPRYLRPVCEAIRDYPGRTITELAVQLGVDPRGQIRRRVQESLRLGFIEVHGHRRCNVTRWTARTFVLRYPDDPTAFDHPIIHSSGGDS